MNGKEVVTKTETYDKRKLNGGIQIINNEWHLSRDSIETDGRFTSNTPGAVRRHGYASGYVLDMTYTMTKRNSSGGESSGGGGCGVYGNSGFVSLMIAPVLLMLKLFR
ncbi:hypothetical protein [Aminomonas paucivorans]|uniref:hypothetical protein n=1 Tax=Aminomonas paucivorans TaxID=81412 RepID=UPI0012E9BAA9|nr:hypothetical protein [Aminomonas paucivorans]